VLRDEAGRLQAVSPPQPRDQAERRASEISAGVMVADLSILLAALRRIIDAAPRSACCITDTVAVLREGGHRVGALHQTHLPGALGDPRAAADPALQRAVAGQRTRPVDSCPRCAAQRSVGPDTGLLIADGHACLAVDKPGFNSGQLVVFPRRHVTCLLSAEAPEAAAICRLLREGERALREVYHFDALNIGYNSGGGEHLAVRLIPRWTGDLNYLPLVSGLKPVPESPRVAWNRLRKVLP
jgi:diadenosine tetraphosphate (Ap4A) HIT family hydrolase